jgi:glutamine amidotransferase
MPAWNDANLQSLAEQIRSPLFFAHVRASTGTATTRLNCHPFRQGPWLFMHNGKIGGYSELRRELEHLIAPAYYRFRDGSTDSELFFCLMLGFGLDHDPEGAFARTVGLIEGLMRERGITEPFRMTAAVTDGRRIIALRHSSDGASPSLFYGHGCHLTVEADQVLFGAGSGTVLVLSEPLDAVSGSWSEVGESQLLWVEDGCVAVRPFQPAHAPALVPA